MSDATKTFEKVVRLVASKDRKIKEQQAEIEGLQIEVKSLKETITDYIFDGDQDTTMHDMYRALTGQDKPELERLQAIVDKLPKTADGVLITPGMEVWQRQTQDGGETWDVISRQVTKVFWPYCGWIQRRCFSTRQAAKEAGEGE